MATTRSRLTEEQRAERRQADRDRLREATEALLSSEGWRRWVRARSTFHVYSLSNTMLLSHQCHARGIEPTHVAGFRAWIGLGRCVRKGETALRIFAPMTVKERDGHGAETGERMVLFKTAFVFDVSQTEPLAGVEPVALEPPRVPVDGDSHAHLLVPLEQLAEEIGFPVSYAQLEPGTGGLCDYKHRRIVIEERQPANRKVRVAIHELAHALGASSERYGREHAEVIAETASHIVCAGTGLQTAGEAVPYIAGWGDQGALEAITAAAELIDTIARRIEQALGPSASAPAMRSTTYAL
jgi:antirestriction protein ArdC